VEVIGVSFDTPAENAAFAAKYEFPFPLISDTDRKIGMAYGACENTKDEMARRIAYVIDEQGKIAQAHPKVDARTYPKEQLANL
jgi:peroxiredoxin Q/BCP